MRGSYLFIIRKAIFFDKLDPLWSPQNAARPNLWPARHAAHPQTSHPESIRPLPFVRRDTTKHNLKPVSAPVCHRRPRSKGGRCDLRRLETDRNNMRTLRVRRLAL